MSKQETLAQRAQGPSVSECGSGAHPSARIFAPGLFSCMQGWGRRASGAHDQATFLRVSVGAPTALNGGGGTMSLFLILSLLQCYCFRIAVIHPEASTIGGLAISSSQQLWDIGSIIPPSQAWTRKDRRSARRVRVGASMCVNICLLQNLCHFY